VTNPNLRHKSEIGKTGPATRLATNPDQIAMRRPLRGAALSMSHNCHQEPTTKIVGWYWYEPPDMRSIPKSAKSEDLTGLTFGRLRVIGLLVSKGSSTQASWVCRCSCGVYVPRKAKAIKAALRGAGPLGAMCFFCSKVLEARLHKEREDIFYKTGSWPSDQWTRAREKRLAEG